MAAAEMTGERWGDRAPTPGDRVTIPATGAIGVVQDLIGDGDEMLCQVEHGAFGIALGDGWPVEWLPPSSLSVYSPG